MQLVEWLLEKFGFTGILSPAELVGSVGKFHEWIGGSYKAVRRHKEYPLMVEKGSQLLTGIADLVIETADTILLVDYKTFPGYSDPTKNRESCEWRARSYSGQMALYREMLEKVYPGRKVETVIWFVVAGAVVKVESPSIKAAV